MSIKANNTFGLPVVTPDVRDLVAEATAIAISSNCKSVELVHLAVAVLGATEFGRNVLSGMKCSYKVVIKSYNKLIESNLIETHKHDDIANKIKMSDGLGDILYSDESDLDTPISKDTVIQRLFESYDDKVEAILYGCGTTCAEINSIIYNVVQQGFSLDQLKLSTFDGTESGENPDNNDADTKQNTGGFILSDTDKEYIIKDTEYIAKKIEEAYSSGKMMDARNKNSNRTASFLRNFSKQVDTEIKNNEYFYEMDTYTDEIIEVLSRKLESNPILVGESGIGKTTLVKLLAKRINEGRVPESLKGYTIFEVDQGELMADTMMRGALEAKFDYINKFASSQRVILFMDNMASIISAGAENHSSAVITLLSNALSNDKIKIIGCANKKDYHKGIEKFTGISRRLQIIRVEAPTAEQTSHIVKETKATFEKFHNVRIDNEIIDKVVMLSDKYLKSQQFPTKAFKIVDQAATRAKLHHSRAVSEKDVLHVVSKLSGIEVSKLTQSEVNKLINLDKSLSSKLIGQENAVSTVARAIKRAKAGVRDTNKPLASLMFVGPTGVGKTELCRILCNEESIGLTNMIKIDMSELQEKHSVSKLIGTAPGYVGYGDGGYLTEQVKRNPYSLVLFDEIEKAHPDTYNLLLQLLDEGKLTDGEGTTVDFTHSIIVMTSNAGYGAEKINKRALGFGVETEVDNKTDAEKAEKIAMEALKETFKPEFLNRLDNIVVFNSLTEDNCRDIVKLELNKLSNRLAQNNIKIKFNKTIINKVVGDGYSKQYGARNIKRTIQNVIEDELSDAIINGVVTSGDNVTVGYDKCATIKVNK